MVIELPTRYEVDVSDWRNANYYNENKDNKRLRNCLIKASKSYCMYCGRNLYIDGDCVGQLEHSVDRRGNIGQGAKEETFLTHCKYNLSIACPKCNGSCKTSSRKISFIGRKKDLSCLSKMCPTRCPEYEVVREEYIASNHLILQPDGVEKEGIQYKVGYNLLGHYYEPMIEDNSIEALLFVRNHINTFRLNGERFSYCIIEIAADVVELVCSGVHEKEDIIDFLKSRYFANVIGEKFVNLLDEKFASERIEAMVDFCEMIVLLDAI